MMRPARTGSYRAAAVAVGYCLAGCGAEADRAPPVTVRDSSGVRIVENRSQPDDIPTWTISTEPELRIGVVEGGAAYQFFRILRAVRIAVANAGTQEVRLFNADGVHVRTIGGRGGGPGEYRLMGELYRLPGDSLLVHDRGQLRLTLYAPDGTGLIAMRRENEDGWWFVDAWQATLTSPASPADGT